MKGTPFVICALLGATLAAYDPEKEQNYDDSTQYQDTNIKALMDQNAKVLEQQEQAEVKAAQKPAAPVAKPVEAPKKDAVKKDDDKKKQQKEQEDLYPKAPQALAESELTAENLGQRDMDTEMSNSLSDDEYLQVKSRQGRFAFLINNIQGPEDLSFIQPKDMSFLQISSNPTGKGWHGRYITDADGDGIEDNESISHDELDKFYDPLVYGVAEDIHNTRHGNLPGHKQLWFTESMTEPLDHNQDIVQAKWYTK